MLRIYGCIAETHDLRLVLLAAVVAAFGSFTTIGLLRHVAGLAGPGRWIWLASTALASGSAIWATHFVAMLAYTPGIGAGYAPVLTAVSFLAAIGITGSGFTVALGGGADFRSHLGGGILVGAGIAVMHYTGMAGYNVPGDIAWSMPRVAASVFAGAMLAALSVRVALAGSTWQSGVLAAVLLTAGICAAHFIGMAAVSVTLGGVPGADRHSMTAEWLGVSIAVTCLMLICLATLGLEFDRRLKRSKFAESANLESFADIAVEGLLVCDGDVVVTVNESFCVMSGLSREAVVGTTLSSLFAASVPARTGAELQGVGEEFIVVSTEGEHIPVEVVRRPIHYMQQPHVVVALRDLRERRGAERKIRFLAHHDVLTGLANRAYFADRLGAECRMLAVPGRRFVVMMIDLDRFKSVNDTQGHPVGDLLLKCVADRLHAAVREDDLVARLGGDEFAIVRADAAGTEEMAARLVEVVSAPYNIEGRMIDVGASIGVAVAPRDGDTPEVLMKNADMALYSAKTHGRGRAVFFESDMGLRMQARQQLEFELRQALPHGELRVYYQPLLTCSRDRITSFEALLRWQHPVRGLVGPGEFLPMAEETGMIVEIGAWVLEEACMQAAAWGGGVGVAVNLAPAQFEGAGPVGAVRHALAMSGLDPNLLELEVTEQVLLHASKHARTMLHELHDLGVRVSIDDFGTGHSSLTQLRSFPFDKIKIDQTFVSAPDNDLECAAIVQAVIGLGKSLGICTTAEGVETPEQLERVRRQGCDSIQGYLIGRPMPAEEAVRLLRAPIEMMAAE